MKTKTPVQTIDFGGCGDDKKRHQFVVTVESGIVTIAERLGGDIGNRTTTHAELPVGTAWEWVVNYATVDFNERLKVHGLNTGEFRADGVTYVDRMLGKELCVLAWAVALIPDLDDEAALCTICHNWRALHPEERWWLFSQGNGRVNWRLAIYYALSGAAEGDIRECEGQRAVNEGGTI